METNTSDQLIVIPDTPLKQWQIHANMIYIDLYI